MNFSQGHEKNKIKKAQLEVPIDVLKGVCKKIYKMNRKALWEFFI